MVDGSERASATWRHFKIRPDLLQAAPAYLDLLQEWCREPGLVREATLRRLMERYEHCWLPLLAEWRGTDLEPPTDVHWVWHLHLLLPRHYLEYCQSRIGRILPHRIRIDPMEQRLAEERARVIWKDRYPTEPYDLDLDHVTTSTHNNGTNLSGLLKIAHAVMGFYHQVSLPHYRDANFLFRSMDRYKQFLYVKSRKRNSKVSLPIDILLMWRLHVLHPVEYYSEVYRPLGLYAIPDVDYDGGPILSDTGGLPNSDWRSIIHESLYANGAFYRGPAPYCYLRPLPASLCGPGKVSRCTVSFDEVTVSELWSKDKRIEIEARRMGDTSFTFDPVFRHQGKPSQPLRAKGQCPLGKVVFDSREHRGIEIHVYGRPRGMGSRQLACCTTANRHVSTVFFNPADLFPDRSFSSRTTQYVVPKVSYTDPRVALTCTIQAGEPPPHNIGMDRDPFAPGEVPRDLRKFVGHLPRWRGVLDPGQLLGPDDPPQAGFQVARHG